MNSKTQNNDISLKLSKILENSDKKIEKPVNIITDYFPDKSKLVAFVLAIGLGGFGIHKFYLGEKKRGKLYLIFCWTFIPAILSILETVKIYKMTEQEFLSTYDDKEKQLFVEKYADKIIENIIERKKQIIYFFSDRIPEKLNHLSEELYFTFK